jgi:hypothetical protein
MKSAGRPPPSLAFRNVAGSTAVALRSRWTYPNSRHAPFTKVRARGWFSNTRR